MATRKTAVKAEEVKLDEVKLDIKKAAKPVSGGPFAPKRDGDPFVPCTREEAFLACIAYGAPDDCPDPVTRHELLLYGIAYRMGELLSE